MCFLGGRVYLRYANPIPWVPYTPRCPTSPVTLPLNTLAPGYPTPTQIPYPSGYPTTCNHRPYPAHERTNTCKNITSLQLRLRAVKINVTTNLRLFHLGSMNLTGKNFHTWIKNFLFPPMVAFTCIRTSIMCKCSKFGICPESTRNVKSQQCTKYIPHVWPPNVHQYFFSPIFQDIFRLSIGTC